VTEQHRAVGLHDAMYLIPVLNAALAVGLFAASRTVKSDYLRCRERMEAAAGEGDTGLPVFHPLQISNNLNVPFSALTATSRRASAWPLLSRLILILFAPPLPGRGPGHQEQQPDQAGEGGHAKGRYQHVRSAARTRGHAQDERGQQGQAHGEDVFRAAGHAG
jgi:hypothetical protein